MGLDEYLVDLSALRQSPRGFGGSLCRRTATAGGAIVFLPMDFSTTVGVVMTLLALWYYHSAEGRRFLEGREIRMMLVAVGVAAAYMLLRTHPRFSHEESRWFSPGVELRCAGRSFAPSSSAPLDPRLSFDTAFAVQGAARRPTPLRHQACSFWVSYMFGSCQFRPTFEEGSGPT